jgi:hypothetical protein
MRLPILPELAREQDVRHRVRELRFFEASFRRNLALRLEDTGITSRTDRAKLHAAFLAWVDNFHVTREIAETDRRDFVCYAAGRMLADLFRHSPLSLSNVNDTVDPDLAAWPEGSIYASYCLGVALSVLKQDFDGAPSLSDASTDRRVWESIRENIRDNPDYASPFLDLLIGQTPNWTDPSLPERRPAVRAKQAMAA